MNPKHSLVFFSGGVALILGFVLIGVIPMDVLSESDDHHKEQLTVKENITTQTESKSIEEMNCIELNEFILSFEKGWGTAIPMYNENCS